MGEISSFADVTFALIQKISPRMLKRSDIPNEAYHALREMVSNELSSITSTNFASLPTNGAPSNEHVSENGTDPNKICFGLYDDEDSRMSGCESSEGSQSQNSVEDEFSKCVSKGRVTGYNSSASSLSQLASPSKSLKPSTRARRMTELRALRRKAEETMETHLFSCSEENLPFLFGQWYNSLLDTGDQPVKCYHIIINSLRKFFITNTFGNTVEAMVCDFLQNHVIRSCADLNKQYDGSSSDGDRRLRELELQVLLELYASYLDADSPPKLLDIVRKMRIVYFIASASKMRSFLEEQVADNFFHLTPRLVADVFDELCIQLPDDMEEYDSVWNKDDDLSYPPPQRKESNASQLQQLDQLIEEMRVPDDETTTRKTDIKMSKKKLIPEIGQTIIADGNAKSTSRCPRKSKRLHLSRAIPETPEDKLRVEVKDEETEVVKATPMAKVCSNARNKKSKLSELIKISEERAKIPRAAAMSSLKANKAIMQASHCPIVTRDCLLGLHTPPTRAHRAKSNLLTRFTNVSENNSRKPCEDSGKKSTRVLRSCAIMRNTTTRCITSPQTSFCDAEDNKGRSYCSSTVSNASDSGIDEIIGKEHLERFHRRVDDINKTNGTDDSEVYYEQHTRRSSLFDEDVINSACAKNMQQNRTRRVITPSSAAHLAHTLLNVNNETPLEVWKLPRNLVSPDKMPRMIRTGVSAVKMKKIQRMRERCRTTSPTSSQQSEHSGEAD